MEAANSLVLLCSSGVLYPIAAAHTAGTSFPIPMVGMYAVDSALEALPFLLLLRWMFLVQAKTKVVFAL